MARQFEVQGREVLGREVNIQGPKLVMIYCPGRNVGPL